MPTTLPNRERARLLVLRHGWNSTSYQVLNEGIELWFSKDQEALVGYVRVGKTAIVAGAPICALERLPEVVREWEAYADSLHLNICYFAAEGRLQSCLETSKEHTQVVLGSQPEWSPSNFVSAVGHSASLRAQLHRAQNKGVVVAEWSREQAENNPELWAVLREWLANRGLPTLHFLVEPDTLGDLRDRRIFVAERHGGVIGFVTLCPVSARQGWLTEQFVRSKHAPNGTVELMLFHAIQAVQKESKYATMGMVPLVHRGGSAFDDPRWLAFMRQWSYAHFHRFYNFRGLDLFKSKFHPDQWTLVVVIVRDSTFRFRHLRAIAQAFTIKPPEIAFLTGVRKAVHDELLSLV